jgi:hypothetical protein
MRTFALNNKYLLYFILILVMADMYSLAMSERYEILAVYGTVGFLASRFSKNMLAILVIAMTTANIVGRGNAVSPYNPLP